MLEPIDQVRFDDEFWNERLRHVREVTLPKQYEWLETTGRLDNFRNVAGDGGEFQGRFYDDSDVYKWLEAACYALESEDAPSLREKVDDVVEVIEAAQGDDGYLHTYFMLEAPDDRWGNLSVLHELYCAGHLFEAAVAHHRATGSDRLLDVAVAFADHVDEEFGGDDSNGIPGHEEIELALIKLARAVGDERYLDLAASFVDRRGQPDSRLRWEAGNIEKIPGAEYNPGVDIKEKYAEHVINDNGEYDGRYHQDHLPVREQDRPVGHAVRATYLYSAMTDLAAERDDDELRAAVERIWEHTTTKRMYVTGGLGASYRNEGFTDDYDLPNEAAYAETCAAVGNVFWNDRMARFTGESKYVDTLERALYNGVLAGISVDGERFRYLNPLARTDGPHPLSDLPDEYDSDRFSYDHQGWFTCACCPANAARLLASLEKYVYMTDGETLYANLYAGSSAIAWLDETDVALAQETDYPWEGEVTIAVDPAEPTAFELALRVPEWADSATVAVDGTRQTVPVVDGYARVDQTWEERTVVDLTFDQSARQIEAHPKVHQNTGKVAVQRGPIVYCLEERDNARSPHELRIGDDASWEPRYRPDMFEGVTTLAGRAFVLNEDDWEGTLYRPRTTETWEAVEAVAVPYYAWGQRDDSEMAVWVPKR